MYIIRYINLKRSIAHVVPVDQLSSNRNKDKIAPHHLSFHHQLQVGFYALIKHHHKGYNDKKEYIGSGFLQSIPPSYSCPNSKELSTTCMQE